MSDWALALPREIAVKHCTNCGVDPRDLNGHRQTRACLTFQRHWESFPCDPDDNLITKEPCPKCGVHRWWTTFMAGNLVVLLGGFGHPAYSECHNCGYQERITNDPQPWDPGTVFPHPDPEP